MEQRSRREERRRLERFDLQAPTRIVIRMDSGRRGVLSLMTRNVSSMGAFVNTAQPLPEGMPVKLELLLSAGLLKRLLGEGEKARIRVRGKVIRSDREGMAIEFDTRYKFVAANGANFA